MRITRITAAYYPDNVGTSVNSREITRRLSERHKCRVITFFPRPDMYVGGVPELKSFETLDRAQIKRIKPLQRVFPSRLSSAIDIMRVAINVLKDEADILHLHGYSYPVMVGGMIAARVRRIPYVVTMAGGEIRDAEARGGKIPKLFLTVLKNASLIIAIGDYLKRKTIEFGADADKTISILNGIDLKKFDVDLALIKKKRENEFGNYETLLVLVGGMTCNIKGHDYAIEVLAEVIKDFPKTLLLFAGDGVARKDFEAHAKKLGVFDNVRFLGWVDNEKIAELLLMSDIYLMCSRSEGFPTVVMEAMAAGLPVVAFRNGGAECIVRDGETGYLVQQDDDKIKNAARKVKLLISDEEKRRNMGNAAKMIAAENFGWDRIIKKYEEIYSNAIKGRR